MKFTEKVVKDSSTEFTFPEEDRMMENRSVSVEAHGCATVSRGADGVHKEVEQLPSNIHELDLGRHFYVLHRTALLDGQHQR